MRQVLDSKTIREALPKLSWAGTDWNPEELSKLVDLASWAIQLPQDQLVNLAEPDGDAPTFTQDLFPDKSLGEVRMRFEKGERIALRIPLKVMRILPQAETQKTYFEVFLERDPSLSRGSDHYVRQGITITGISRLRDKKVRGIVVVKDKPLSSLLGDAETPAHTDWQERSSKIRDRYTKGASRVRFVRNSLRDLVAHLSQPAKGMDKDLLRDVFYLNLPAHEGTETTKKESDKKGPVSPVPTIQLPPARRRLRVEPVKGGFCVSKDPKSTERPRAVRVEVAYEVRRGNPFSRYDPLDFDLSKSPIGISAKCAKVTKAQNNILEFRVVDDNFAVTVKGFDVRRDIKIRAEQMGEQP